MRTFRLSQLVGLRRTPTIIRAFVFCAVAGALAAVWSPLAPTRLFDFDAANFALSLEYFQPTAHQPQPPGYPLYVGLAKVIHLLVDDVPLTFLVAGLLGAAAAVLMLWILGEHMFGRQAGIFAALLFMTNPILWQTGMSDQVRIYIAVISIGVALAAWPLFEDGDAALRSRRLVVSCLLFGILTGFRPEMVVSMTPLLLFAAVRNKMNFRHYLAAALALGVGMAPWLIVLLMRVGGIGGFIAMMRIYSADQASGSSVLFGAGWSAAWKMVASAFWWASLGVVSWIPAALLVHWGKVREGPKRTRFFLLVWFLSLFLFSIAVHIAASGHALGFIPVLCLAGGWVLYSVGRTRGRLLMIPCVILALTLNVIFFFKPYAREVREASYHTIAGVSAINEATLEKIDLITQQNSAFLVTDNNAWVSWRILEYYYPETPLLYLPGPWANPVKPPPAWLFQSRIRVQDVDAKAELNLPSCATIVWLVSDNRSKREVLAVKDAEDERYFIATPAGSGMHYKVGRYRLATSPEPCRPAH
jgi:hypothetical protein